MKLVLVEWNDTRADLRYVSVDEIDTAPMLSIGLLVKDNKDKIVLTSMLGLSPRDCNCLQAIPKGCIKRMRSLKVR